MLLAEVGMRIRHEVSRLEQVQPGAGPAVGTRGLTLVQGPGG